VTGTVSGSGRDNEALFCFVTRGAEHFELLARPLGAHGSVQIPDQARNVAGCGIRYSARPWGGDWLGDHIETDHTRPLGLGYLHPLSPTICAALALRRRRNNYPAGNHRWPVGEGFSPGKQPMGSAEPLADQILDMCRLELRTGPVRHLEMSFSFLSRLRLPAGLK